MSRFGDNPNNLPPADAMTTPHKRPDESARRHEVDQQIEDGTRPNPDLPPERAAQSQPAVRGAPQPTPETTGAGELLRDRLRAENAKRIAENPPEGVDSSQPTPKVTEVNQEVSQGQDVNVEHGQQNMADLGTGPQQEDHRREMEEGTRDHSLSEQERGRGGKIPGER